jgi:hypothetical protein
MLFGAVKRMKMNHSSMNGVVLTNFDVVNQNATPAFQHTGMWYEYFTGDSVDVQDVNGIIPMEPGEYRIYTDVRLAKPVITDAPASIDELNLDEFEMKIFPNPATEKVTIEFSSENISNSEILIINMKGEVVLSQKGLVNSGINSIETSLNGLSKGTYHLLLKVGNSYGNKEIVIQ